MKKIILTLLGAGIFGVAGYKLYRESHNEIAPSISHQEQCQDLLKLVKDLENRKPTDSEIKYLKSSLPDYFNKIIDSTETKLQIFAEDNYLGREFINSYKELRAPFESYLEAVKVLEKYSPAPDNSRGFRHGLIEKMQFRGEEALHRLRIMSERGDYISLDSLKNH